MKTLHSIKMTDYVISYFVMFLQMQVLHSVKPNSNKTLRMNRKQFGIRTLCILEYIPVFFWTE
jgi:hypothetical protein